MTVGEKIQALRLRAGLSQSQLAEQLCVSRAAVAKWENNNGLPEVSNLRVLATFLNIDMNELLDETKSIPVDEKAVTIKPPETDKPPETFCGKSCSRCAYREPLNCPGCREGQGRRYGACRVAKCCRDRILSSCSACPQRASCEKHRNIPGQQDEKMKGRALTKEKIKKHAPTLSKWLWVLFWLVIAITAVDVLCQDFVESWLPWLHLIGEVLNIICCLVYGWVLIRLSSVTEYYRTAGVCQIAASLVQVVKIVLPDYSGLILVLSLLTLPIALASRYNEFMGHGSALEGIADDLSSVWKDLWKGYIGLYIAVFLSAIFSGLGGLLLLLVLFLSLVGILGLGIYETVLLYRTAQLFKDFSDK